MMNVSTIDESHLAIHVNFEEVTGPDATKREVLKLVDFLRDPQPFRNVGAEFPHGVLLMGPPGTGKRCWHTCLQTRLLFRSFLHQDRNLLKFLSA